MRELTAHKINECNDSIKIEVRDEPGSGGANHLYQMSGFDSSTNPSCPFTKLFGKPAKDSRILFQNGPIGRGPGSGAENGVNGVTNEALLAIVMDRLEGFHRGPFKCRENALALTKIEEAMHWLSHRARLREQRGVEGTHTV